MSPYGASLACGAPPMTAPGYVPPGTSLKVGALPLMTPWPTTLDAVSVPWPPMAGSKSPVQASSSPGPESRQPVRDAAERRAARNVRRAVGDVVEEAAGDVRVAVAVHVAIRRPARPW